MRQVAGGALVVDELEPVLVLVVTDEPEICRVTCVLRIRAPLFPVTVRVYVPTDDPGDAVTVSVDVATPFACGVMGLGRLKLTPAGAGRSQETDNATVELNPLCERTA